MPDQVDNPYGDPLATIEYDTPFTPWIDIDNGHQGVWYIEDWIELYIPNTGVDNPFKYVWLQLTFYADGGGEPQFFTDPPLSSVEEIAFVQLDDYYYHGTYQITLEPNPAFESIYIMPRDCTIYVDEIVVDTLCAPEPGTLMLLLAGAFVIRKRR